MSTVQGLRTSLLASILFGVTLTVGPSSAQVSAQGIFVGTAQGTFTTERPSSVLIFPKVVNTDPDTIIQIATTSNQVTYVKCFYTDGRRIGGEAVWQTTDFELQLTRQQPPHWAVSRGRAVVPYPLDMNVQTSGLDPGAIPPVSPGFTGFLLCVETNVDGSPKSGNSLKGEATIGDVTGLGGTNHVSKYNAIGIPGCVSAEGPCGVDGEANDGDSVLKLDGHEYAMCPGGQYLNFIAEGGPDLAIDGAGNTPSVVSTNLTAVPCGFDYENAVPGSTIALVSPVRNEFEELSSVSSAIPIDCWFSEDLGGPHFGPTLTLAGLHSNFGTAIIRPPAGGNLKPVLAVANVLHTAGDLSSDTAAMNLPFCVEQSSPSLCIPVSSEIRLPSLR
jgi:hypothetical protein